MTLSVICSFCHCGIKRLRRAATDLSVLKGFRDVALTSRAVGTAGHCLRQTFYHTVFFGFFAVLPAQTGQPFF